MPAQASSSGRSFVPALFRANPEIVFLCVATMLLTTGQGIAVPIVPLFADTLGVTVAAIGLVISAFALARLLTNMPAAYLSDRFGRRLLLVGGPFVAAVGNLLSGFADSLVPLLVFRFIAGIGSAAFITGAVIFIGDISSPSNRGRMMSAFQGAFSVGITLGPALGGFTAELFGLRGPFILVGIVSFVAGVWALFRMPETRRRADQRSHSPADGMTATGRAAATGGTMSFLLSREFLLISGIFFINFFARGGAQFTLLPIKAAQDLHLSPGQIGLLFTLVSVIGFIVLPVVGGLSDKWGRKRLIVPGTFVMAGSLGLLAFSPTLVFYSIGMALYGLGQGIEGPAPVAYVADISPPDKQAIAQGAARSLGDFALLIAAPLMGLAADLGGATIPLLANAVLVGAVGLIFLAFAKDPARLRIKAEAQKLAGAH